jgi:hypothetical protein
MRINAGESLVALAIVAVAGGAAYIGAGYPRGTLAQMGAGYFPLVIGIATVLAGLAVLLDVAFSATRAPKILWRPTLLALAAMAVWGLLAERFGLFPASAALILLASLGQPPFRPWSAIVSAVVVSAAAVAIFIYGFSLPLHPIKW